MKMRTIKFFIELLGDEKMTTIQSFMDWLGYDDAPLFLADIKKGNIDNILKDIMTSNAISIENLDIRHYQQQQPKFPMHYCQKIIFTEKLEHINVKKALLARMVTLGSSSIESLRQDENIFINKKRYIEDTGEIGNEYKDKDHDAIGYEPIFGRHVKGLKLEYIAKAEALLKKEGLPNGFIYPIDSQYAQPLTKMLQEAKLDNIQYKPASNHIAFNYHVFYVMSDPGSADNELWKNTTPAGLLNCGCDPFLALLLNQNANVYENQNLNLSIKLSAAKSKYLTKYRQGGQNDLTKSGINRQNAYVFIKKQYVLDFTAISTV